MGQEAIKMLSAQLVKSEVPVRDWKYEGRWAGMMMSKGGCSEKQSLSLHDPEKRRVLGGNLSAEPISQPTSLFLI